MASEWMQQKCGGPPIRLLDDGKVEISGLGSPASPLPKNVLMWKSLIYENAAAYDIPAHLIAGIMALESGGNPKAKSFCCYGLMQLLPATAATLAGRKLSESELYDPATNVDLGSKLLSQLWKKYRGNIVNIAFSYNAGSPRCGSGCVRAKEKPHPCEQPCPPNQWNLVADCYDAATGTVDYGGRVIRYMNGALSDFPPDGGGGDRTDPTIETPGRSPLPLLLLAGAAAAGGYLYWSRGKR